MVARSASTRLWPLQMTAVRTTNGATPTHCAPANDAVARQRNRVRSPTSTPRHQSLGSRSAGGAPPGPCRRSPPRRCPRRRPTAVWGLASRVTPCLRVDRIEQAIRLAPLRILPIAVKDASLRSRPPDSTLDGPPCGPGSQAIGGRRNVLVRTTGPVSQPCALAELVTGSNPLR